jgi:hypothetical protein
MLLEPTKRRLTWWVELAGRHKRFHGQCASPAGCGSLYQFVAKLFAPIPLALTSPFAYLCFHSKNGGANAALQVRLLGQGLY